jgi:hypothetical protein
VKPRDTEQWVAAWGGGWCAGREGGQVSRALPWSMLLCAGLALGWTMGRRERQEGAGVRPGAGVGFAGSPTGKRRDCPATDLKGMVVPRPGPGSCLSMGCL